MMCYECCRHFRGWCKSFTKMELYLSLAQAVLLTAFIGFLIFLVLHFITCSKRDAVVDTTESIPTSIEQETASHTDIKLTSYQPLVEEECTWAPSKTTHVKTHFYWNLSPTPLNGVEKAIEHARKEKLSVVSNKINLDDNGEVEIDRKSFIVALVRIQPPLKVIFGCILTTLNNFWTITAASCIESIEEVDSLDSFVLMEGFGEDKQGSVHTISDINVHPLYQGTNRSFDLAAMRSEDALNPDTRAQLPSAPHSLQINLGEDLDILGFGKYI